MPHSSALRQRAAASAADSGPAAARRRPHSVDSAGQLERLSSRLDALIYDVRLGATSHRQHEANVEEAEAIATELRGVFRAPSKGSDANRPLRQQGGQAWW